MDSLSEGPAKFYRKQFDGRWTRHLRSAMPTVTRKEAAGSRMSLWSRNSALVLFPDFSPDGRWLAYTSSLSESGEVYVQPFPGPGTSLQISSEGGTEPIWAPDGKRLYFRRRAQVWAVDVRASAFFSAGKPRLHKGLRAAIGIFRGTGSVSSWSSLNKRSLSL